MNEMYKILIRHKLTPNQFYLLWAIREKLTTPLINTDLELRRLKREGYLLEDNSLTADSKRIVKEVEAYFKVSKKKTSGQLMGTDFAENMKTYNECYPNIKLPSGQAARSAMGNLEPAFRWFFINYEFSWETIIKATNLYLDERERENWNYTRKSQYFVRKQNPDKSWDSLLADFCMQVENGTQDPSNKSFPEKVY
jgi:hypothetical protein